MTSIFTHSRSVLRTLTVVIPDTPHQCFGDYMGWRGWRVDVTILKIVRLRLVHCMGVAR